MLPGALLAALASLWALRRLRRRRRDAEARRPPVTTPPPTREAVRRLAVEHGLARVADRLAGELAQDAWQLCPLEAPRSAPSSFSKLGGRPELPRDVDWPRGRDGRQLAFLGQLDLAGIPTGPGSGKLLYLFWDQSSEQGSEHRLLLADGPASTERDAEEEVFLEQRVSLRRSLTLPGYSDLAVDGLGLDDEEQEAYFNLVDVFTPEPDFHLGGAAHWIQDDGREEAEMQHRGLKPEQWRSHMAEVTLGATAWELVLELGAAGPFAGAPAWGDSGSVYLLRRDSGETALVMQCH